MSIVGVNALIRWINDLATGRMPALMLRLKRWIRRSADAPSVTFTRP